LRDRDRVTALFGRTQRCVDAQLDQRFARLERADKLLVAFSYREVLKRGYALVRDEKGQPLRSAAAIANGTKLDIEMSDGNVKAVAGETVAAPAPRPIIRRRRSRPTSAEGQGTLF
jgi:exodeoxyribonuclease VII large subunit